MSFRPFAHCAHLHVGRIVLRNGVSLLLMFALSLYLAGAEFSIIWYSKKAENVPLAGRLKQLYLRASRYNDALPNAAVIPNVQNTGFPHRAALSAAIPIALSNPGLRKY